MQPPVDYPIQDVARTTQFSMDELTYSVLLDRMENSPQQQNAQPAKNRNAANSNSARKKASLTPAPKLRPIFKPFAAVTQSLLSNHRPVVNVNTGVFSRWGRAPR